jgi:acetyl-CoA carboxylase alpha subunit
MFNRTNYNVGCYYSQELGEGDKAIKDGIGRLFGRPVVIICHHAPKGDLRPD